MLMFEVVVAFCIAGANLQARSVVLMMLKFRIALRCWSVAVIAPVLALSIAAGVASATPPAMEADFDGNGVVDQYDLVKWSEGFSCSDPNYNGGNFLDWQRQLGQRSVPGGVVPEPATLIVWSLLGVAGAGICVWRQNRPA